MENSLHTGWNKGLNNKINHINETALRIVYEDYSSSFEDLFIKDRSVTIRQRNLQQLTIENFKVQTGIAPTIMTKYLPVSKTILII